MKSNNPKAPYFKAGISQAMMAVLILIPLAASVPAASTPVQRMQNVRPRRMNATPVTQKLAKLLINTANQPDVDLRPEINSLGIPVRPSQNGRGTCSVFAMTFLLEFMYGKNYGMKNADLSEEFLNFASNLAIGQQNDGGYFDDVDAGYQKYGIAAEALAPYQTSFNSNLSYTPNVMAKALSLKPHFKPHYIKKWDVSTGLLPSQLLAILFQLKQGRPVAGGLRWPKAQSIPTETIAGVTMMKVVPASEVFDGHSIAFVGFKASDKFPGGGYLIFRNHWGTGFMDEGYGYMSFAYAAQYTNDLVEYVLP